MKKNWRWLFSQPGTVSLDKLRSGDVKSPNLKKIIARLRDVDKSISNDTYKCFRAVAKHRNKMVHFSHHEIECNEKAKDEIVADICRAWTNLYRLFMRWHRHFHNFGDQIARADEAMKRLDAAERVFKR